MPRTALELSAAELETFRPRVFSANEADRRQRAFAVAQEAAGVLRDRFGATRVVVFGSLTDTDSFTRWSDIDLAVAGVAPRSFYRAVAASTGASEEFEVDLVDLDSCGAQLRQRIEAEGIPV